MRIEKNKIQKISIYDRIHLGWFNINAAPFCVSIDKLLQSDSVLNIYLVSIVFKKC